MFNFLKRETKQRTMLDDVKEITGRLLIRGYRRIGAQNQCAPTTKTTDDKIVEIYYKVIAAFDGAADQRRERIPAPIKNFIVLKFFQVYEMLGDVRLENHLKYEVEKYLTEGLRDDYKSGVELFDAKGSDPDVKRLLEIQQLIREQMLKQ